MRGVNEHHLPTQVSTDTEHGRVAAAQVKQVQQNLHEMKETIKKELTAPAGPLNAPSANS